MKLDLSYSSINKLLFSPKLFYSFYYLNEREEKLEPHLVEGSLTHCFILQPEEFDNLFITMPGKLPSASIVKILQSVASQTNDDALNLEDHSDLILQTLIERNLYQSLKEDSKRLEKVLTADSKNYYKYLKTRKGKQAVDEDMIDRCKAYAEIMRQEKSIAAHLELTKSDAYKVFNEIPLEYKNYFENFSLKGILDRLVIDEFQNADIIDVKTTGKTISDFKDTVEFYNYWLQAAIYIMLVHKVYGIPLDKINYSFWVIDKYEQVYNFGVSNESKLKWLNRFDESFSQATYMIKNMLFDKPFEFQSSERIML
jgi:hypothetical protein